MLKTMAAMGIGSTLTACGSSSDSPFPDDAFTISATRPVTDLDRSTFAFDHLEVDEPVVDRDSLTDAQIVDEVLIVDVDAAFLGIVG